jgi:hypothetical protein
MIPATPAGGRPSSEEHTIVPASNQETTLVQKEKENLI